ncbi:MAG: molybdenum cofactor guanylyltransferase [Syntrophomonadaceae bacterium]|nr:molybdenum cofactor guanylyltransferase [Syntrophomonadaceae bacterium]MDD4562660.1 molybdenum cofactor guanylyltransferase [Syntrophomonadaceae bacterium]
MQTSGVIMAGGRSSRMKFNKAFAEVAGKPVIQIIIEKLQPLFQEIIIISNEPEFFTSFGLPVYRDIYPYLGPVGGIHSALVNASHDRMFILGCDMPFMNIQLVQYMLGKISTYDSVVPEIASYLQPLAAVYNRTCLPVFTECLEHDKLKLTRIFSELNALVLKEDELQKFGNVKEVFFNVNDPKALAEAQKIAGRLL